MNAYGKPDVSWDDEIFRSMTEDAMQMACGIHLCTILARDASRHVPAKGKSSHMDGIRTNKMHVKVHQIGRKN